MFEDCGVGIRCAGEGTERGAEVAGEEAVMEVVWAWEERGVGFEDIVGWEPFEDVIARDGCRL